MRPKKSQRLTSLTSGGSWTNDQHTGEVVDPTGLTFTVNYSDGDTASVTPQTLTPTVWGETAGTQICTFTYTEDDESVSCEVEANVQEPVVPVLETLTASGSLTNLQYVGTTPDLTGLTFTAGYSDGSSTTVSASAITVSPATYPEGNPNNLREVDLSLSYTDEEVTATTGLDNVVTHRPDVQSITLGAAGHIYFDYDVDHWYDGQKFMLGAGDLLSSGGSQGDWACGWFDADAYANDTTVDGQVFTSWIPEYSIDANMGPDSVVPSGTINTSGYIPETGNSQMNDPDEWYIAWSQGHNPDLIPATYSGPSTTIYCVVAPLANNISAGVGYKKTDFDTTAQYTKIYQVNLIVE